MESERGEKRTVTDFNIHKICLILKNKEDINIDIRREGRDKGLKGDDINRASEDISFAST